MSEGVHNSVLDVPLWSFSPGFRRRLEGTVGIPRKQAQISYCPALTSCLLELLLQFCLAEGWLQHLCSLYHWLLHAGRPQQLVVLAQLWCANYNYLLMVELSYWFCTSLYAHYPLSDARQPIGFMSFTAVAFNQVTREEYTYELVKIFCVIVSLLPSMRKWAGDYC